MFSNMKRHFSINLNKSTSLSIREDPKNSQKFSTKIAFTQPVDNFTNIFHTAMYLFPYFVNNLTTGYPLLTVDNRTIVLHVYF